MTASFFVNPVRHNKGAVCEGKKGRGPIACAKCRARKVRCEITESGSCSNCKSSNVECVLPRHHRLAKHFQTQIRPRTKKPCIQNNVKSSGQLGLRSMATSTEPTQEFPTQVSTDIGLEFPQEPKDVDNPVQVSHPMCEFQELGHSDKPRPFLHPELPSHLGAVESSEPVLGSNMKLSTSSETAELCSLKLTYLKKSGYGGLLPAFLLPIAPRTTQDDVAYLIQKGVFTIPSPSLQDALLRAYIDYVHPFMPLLDLHNFLNTVTSSKGLHDQISLLLYYSVMFAAAAFVDVEDLYEAGYSTPMELRSQLFLKARILYDFDYEKDRLVLTQSLLLMTHWQKSLNDYKDAWHWLGIAISLAKTIGLHQDPADMRISIHLQKLRRRIWWCCVMRDRLIALGMRQPTRITEEDFNVSILQASDFELITLPKDDTHIPRGCVFLRDINVQQKLTTLCVFKYQLSGYVDQVLRTQYACQNFHDGQNTSSNTLKLFPKQTSGDIEQIKSIDVKLVSWMESLPLTCQYRPLDTLGVKVKKDIVAVHRTVVHILYFTTLAALHRPQLNSSPLVPSSVVFSQMQGLSKKRTQSAAVEITRRAFELNEFALDRYLPNISVAGLLFAMTISILEMKNANPPFQRRYQKCFIDGLTVLKELRTVHPAADWALSSIGAMYHSPNLDIGPFSVRAIHSRHHRIRPTRVTQPSPNAISFNQNQQGHHAYRQLKPSSQCVDPSLIANDGIDTSESTVGLTESITNQLAMDWEQPEVDLFEWSEIDWNLTVDLEPNIDEKGG